MSEKEWITSGRRCREPEVTGEDAEATRDKDSGIVNDPNDWVKEHNEPRYIIELVKRIVRVSLETMKIVGTLPALNEIKE